MTKPNPFRYFKTSPEIIRLAVMLYVRFPLSLRNVEDLLHERGIDVSHEAVRFWWNRFGPMFAAEVRRRRAKSQRADSGPSLRSAQMTAKRTQPLLFNDTGNLILLSSCQQRAKKRPAIIFLIGNLVF